MDTEKSIEILNSLIGITVDSISGYTLASSVTEDSELMNLFNEISSTYNKSKKDLINEVIQSGIKPMTLGNPTSKISRIWTELKAAFTGTDNKSLLNSSESSEAYALQGFQEALTKNTDYFSNEQLELIKANILLIKTNHNKVKGLYDELVAYK